MWLLAVFNRPVSISQNFEYEWIKYRFFYVYNFVSNMNDLHIYLIKYLIIHLQLALNISTSKYFLTV